MGGKQRLKEENVHIGCGGLSQGAAEPPSHSLPLQWDGRENHKGKRVETDGGTESFTGKAKAAGAQPSQTLLPSTGRCSASPGEPGPCQGAGTGMTNIPSPLLPPSSVLHAEHGAVQSGTSLGHWDLSCAPSQLPVPPSPCWPWEQSRAGLCAGPAQPS